jgi:hypothetical protein
MKNILAENMLRFGLKNLSESEKQNLSKLAEQTEAAFPAGKWAEETEMPESANYEARDGKNLQALIQYYDSNSPSPLEGKQAIVFFAEPKIHSKLIQKFYHVRDNVAAPTFTIKQSNPSDDNPDRIFAMSSDNFTTPYIVLNTKTNTMYYLASSGKQPIRVVNGALSQKLRVLHSRG